MEERASVCRVRVGGEEREREREKEGIHVGETEQESTWLLLLYVFFPLGLPYANWAQLGVLFYLKSSLRSSDLSLTFLCSIFVGFSRPCLLATTLGTPFPYSNYLTEPIKELAESLIISFLLLTLR